MWNKNDKKLDGLLGVVMPIMLTAAIRVYIQAVFPLGSLLNQKNRL